MNKTSIKNIISFFSYCHLYIPNSKKIQYNDINKVLERYISETDFNELTNFVYESNYFLQIKDKRPSVLLIEIERIVIKLNTQLSPKEKLSFIISILKLVKIDKNDTNLFLDDVLYFTAKLFSYDTEEINSIKKICYSNHLSISDYEDSVLLTNEQPSYIDLIDGLNVIYNPHFKFKVWVKNIKSINNMLFKIIELEESAFLAPFKVGDVIVYSRAVQSLLNIYDISLNQLSLKMMSDKSSSRVHIKPTERSPSIILNTNENRIELEGVSMVLHPDDFFRPVFYWLEKMKNSNPKSLEVHVNLSFFNTYTAKFLLKLFIEISSFEKHGLGTKTSFFWYNEEDDVEMKEAGEHYASIIDRKFKFVNVYQSELTYAY